MPKFASDRIRNDVLVKLRQQTLASNKNQVVDRTSVGNYRHAIGGNRKITGPNGRREW